MKTEEMKTFFKPCGTWESMLNRCRFRPPGSSSTARQRSFFTQQHMEKTPAGSFMFFAVTSIIGGILAAMSAKSLRKYYKSIGSECVVR